MRNIDVHLSPIAELFYQYHLKQARSKRITEIMKKAVLICIEPGVGSVSPHQSISIGIPEQSRRGKRYDNTGKLHVPSEKEQWLSEMFEEMFYHELKHQLSVVLAKNTAARIDLTVQGILDQYGIGEDLIKLESLIKRLRRDGVRRGC